MRMPTFPKWSSLALLSVIVPVSLLVTFRLTGVLPEPPTPETITVETVSWNMSRPADIVTIDEWVKNSYLDEIVSASLSVHVAGYRENWPILPSDGDDDIIDLGIVADVNVSDGFVRSLVVRFPKTDSHTTLYIERHPETIRLDNLKLERIRDPATERREAYLETTGLNQPKNCSLEILSFWVLQDRNNLNHWITVTFEATYYNGTTWKKIEIPIQLGVVVG